MSAEIGHPRDGTNAPSEMLSAAENAIRELAMDIVLERSAVGGMLACLSVLRIARAMEAEASGMYEALYGSHDTDAEARLAELSRHHRHVGLEAGADLLEQRRTGCH